MSDVTLGASLELNVAGVQKGSKDAVTSLEAVQSEIIKTQEAIKNAADPSSIDRLGAKLNSLQRNFSVLSGKSREVNDLFKTGSAGANDFEKSMDKVGEGSRSLSLLINRNLHGVAEIFIAPGRAALILANDMPQLINRYRELAQANRAAAAAGGEVVSSASLLKAAFDPLNLVIGVGLAVIIKYGGELYNWATGADKAKEKAKELKKEQDKLQSIQDSANRSIGEQIAKVQILQSTMTNAQLPLKERYAAYDQFQKLYPSYLNNVTKDQALVGGLAKTINEDLVPALMRIGQAKAAEGILGEYDAQLIKIQREIAKTKKASDEAFKSKDLYSDKDVYNTYMAGREDVAGSKISELKQKFKDVNKEAYETLKIIGDVMAKTPKLTIEGKDVAIPPKKTRTGKSDAEKLADELALIGREKESLDKKFKDGVINNVQYSNDKIRLLIKSIDDLHNRFNQPFDTKAIQDLRKELYLAQSQAPVSLIGLRGGYNDIKNLGQQMAAVYKDANDLALKEYKNAGKGDLFEVLNLDKANLVQQIRAAGVFDTKNKYGVKVPISLSLSESDLQNASDDIKKDLDSLNSIINSSISNSITNLSESIGQAIGGGEGLKGIFDGFKSSLGQAIQDFGKWIVEQAITIKVLKQAITKWIVANPGLAIAAGVGLIALGAAIKASMNNPGTNFTGTSSSGGSFSGNIGGGVSSPAYSGATANTPTGNINTALANAFTNMEITGELKASGNDLVTVFNRTKKLQGI